MKIRTADTIILQEMKTVYTAWGSAVYIRIYSNNDAPMSWREVWERFHSSYPDRWAVQFFPPSGNLVDDANYYHLYVLDSPPPRQFDIQARL